MKYLGVILAKNLNKTFEINYRQINDDIIKDIG